MISVQNNYFFINTKNTSYIIRILPDGTLNHCYYGTRLPEDNMNYYQLFRPHDITVKLQVGDLTTTPDALPQECPGYGRGDFGRPAIAVASVDGRAVNEFKYCSYQIISGKPVLEGLPQMDVNTGDVQTLEIVLKDVVTGVEVICSYTSFFEEDIIARHTVVCNNTKDTVMIRSIASAVVDFESTAYDLVSLGGAWERERMLERYPLHHGETSVSDRYGLSGHHVNPFMALVEKEAGEYHGNVYGFSLIYSGNFNISAEVGQYDRTRVWMGIHPEMFEWELSEGGEFVSPEALLTYSSNGFVGMSHNFHAVCRNHLGACAKKTLQHPIVLNLWEAMHTNISEEKIYMVLEESKGLGIDTLVIDDGWFGCRNDETTSLGDWHVNTDKFPNGLATLSECCRQNGMKLGLWFEPEMISRDSELYREHPDWCIHIPGISETEIRNQLVLDMSRPEIVEAVYHKISEAIREYDVSYVKWDMNRSITDNGSSWLPSHRQKEHGHRHILGVYELMNRLVTTYPNVFFEGCASGGGRFDFGILYYMPQIWTSDNTDAYERMKIQYGTSFVYPPETMSAHVSACPNISTGRITPFKTRGDVAQFFSFGYELDPSELTSEEKVQIVEQTTLHRKVEELYENGDFYRLRNPFSSNSCAWQYVSKDRNHAIVFFSHMLKQPNYCGEYLHLKGLEDEKYYKVKPLDITVSGKTLKYAGLPILEQVCDFSSVIFELEVADEI